MFCNSLSSHAGLLSCQAGLCHAADYIQGLLAQERLPC